MADPDHPSEQESVAEFVGDHEITSYVEMVELEAVDAPAPSKENKSVDSVSVLDCIEKFSQMEQLVEEKEQ